MSKFFDLWDIFIGNVTEDIYNSKRILISIFDEFVFNQDKMKELLGDKFEKALLEIIELLKKNLNNLKIDYDFMYEKLKEENPALRQMFSDLEISNKVNTRVFPK